MDIEFGWLVGKTHKNMWGCVIVEKIFSSNGRISAVWL